MWAFSKNGRFLLNRLNIDAIEVVKSSPTLWYLRAVVKSTTYEIGPDYQTEAEAKNAAAAFAAGVADF